MSELAFRCLIQVRYSTHAIIGFLFSLFLDSLESLLDTLYMSKAAKSNPSSQFCITKAISLTDGKTFPIHKVFSCFLDTVIQIFTYRNSYRLEVPPSF